MHDIDIQTGADSLIDDLETRMLAETKADYDKVAEKVAVALQAELRAAHAKADAAHKAEKDNGAEQKVEIDKASDAKTVVQQKAGFEKEKDTEHMYMRKKVRSSEFR